MRKLSAIMSVCVWVCALSAARAATPPSLYNFLNDPLEDAFTFRCQVAATVVAPTAYLLVNFQDERNYCRVELTPKALNVVEVRGGKRYLLAQSRSFYQGVTPAPTPVAIKRNGARLAVIYGGRTLVRTITTTWRGGALGYGPTDGSVTFTDARYQPVEPVYFSDDFMRGAGAAEWEPLAGEWRIQSIGDPRLAANGFFFVGRGTPNALAAAGRWFWDDYTLHVSVRPTGTDAVGLCAYVQDPNNYFLFRWDTQRKDLIKVFQGKPLPIASAPGGFEPRQWYRLTLSVQADALRVAIDGVPVLESQGQILFGQGKVALYTAGEQGAHFDDVLVTPANEPEVPPHQPEFAEQFTREVTMEGWANPKGEWIPVSNVPNAFWHRGAFFGDHALHLRVHSGGAARSSLTACIGGDGRSFRSGYTLELNTADGKTAAAQLLKQGQRVASADALPLRAEQPLTVSLERRGQHIRVALDDRPLWRFHAPAPLSGYRVGYQVQGWRVDFKDAAVKTPHVYDFTFHRAPTDWRVAAGTWEVASRWTCSPGWAWFGGWSRDLAVVWHKREFAGNVVVQMFVAPRMDPQDNYQRAGNLCITLCGDGRDVNSGYSFIFAGDHNKVTRILRGAQVVQETNQVLLPVPFHGVGHRRWFNVTAEKIGNTLSLYVDYQLALRYTDPQPLSGRHIALWTRNSGMMLARVTIYYEGNREQRSGVSDTRPAPPNQRQPVVDRPHLAVRHIPSIARNLKPAIRNPQLPSAAPVAPPVLYTYTRGLHQLQATFYQDADQGAFQNEQLHKPVFWRTFTRPVATRAEEKIDFNYGAGNPPLPTMRATYWSVQFVGKLYVSVEDDYVFYFDRLDDGARLLLNGKTILESWNVQPASTYRSEPIRLPVGFHTLRLEYCQGDREASLTLAWSSSTLAKEVIPKGERQPQK
ncbi:MAG: PA14 domain-containing protein [Abditibacteriales bacterium]|nr:PA14 domain-containing protein [Abditibacteriales bacterium]MDW8364592.1 PA14 domain-containing protein [Abditibacteriales bacterium]